MPEDVVYWNWVNPTMLCLVTASTVYHWTSNGDSSPTKIFDRHPSLANCQIINYKVNPDEKWMVLVGISANEGRVVGNMQLYNKDRGVSQPLEGHAAAFSTLSLDPKFPKNKLFSFASRTATGAKVLLANVVAYY